MDTRAPITRSQWSSSDSSYWDAHYETESSPESSREEVDEPWEPIDMGGFPTGLDLVRVCFRTVRKDPEILALHAMSTAFGLSFLAVYLYFVVGTLDPGTLFEEFADPRFYFVLFPFIIVSIAAGTFFRGAAITVASIRLRGGDPVAADGLIASGRKAHLIVAWAVVAAVVALVMALLRRGSKGGRRVAVAAADLAWNVATYFVVPVILFEGLGPLEAIERSTKIVMRTWREALGGNFGIGVITFLAILPGFLLYPLGDSAWGTVGGVGLMLGYWIAVSTFFSAVTSVLVAALYQLATTRKMPAGFYVYDDLAGAFQRMKRVKDKSSTGSIASANDRNLMYVRR